MLSSCVMPTYPLHTNYVAWYDLVRIVAVYIVTSFFLGGVGEKDYSRFDRSTWPKRTDDSR